MHAKSSLRVALREKVEARQLFGRGSLERAKSCVRTTRITENQRGPVVHARLQSLVEDLVQEEYRLHVQEDGADVLVRAGRPSNNEPFNRPSSLGRINNLYDALLRARRHLERSIKASDKDLERLHVFLFVLQHAKH